MTYLPQINNLKWFIWQYKINCVSGASRDVFYYNFTFRRNYKIRI